MVLDWNIFYNAAGGLIAALCLHCLADKLLINLLIFPMNQWTYISFYVSCWSCLTEVCLEQCYPFFPAKISRKISMIADQKDGKRLVL